MDSTVVTRYGEQQGAKKGYNPKKPGRNSHHPMMAFIPEVRMVVNAWFRQGNTGSTSNVQAFLEETLEILQNKKVGLVRCDSGFYSDVFLSDLEKRKLNYENNYHHHTYHFILGRLFWIFFSDNCQ